MDAAAETGMNRVRCVVSWACALAILAASGRPLRAGEDDLAIQVIDAESGEPVANSDVVVVLVVRDGHDVPEKLRALAPVELTTDSDGRAGVGGVTDVRDVRVQAGELSGRTVPDPEARETVVFVAKASTAIVQVVDVDGVPRAGVPIVASSPPWPTTLRGRTRGTHGIALVDLAAWPRIAFEVTVRVDLPIYPWVRHAFQPSAVGTLALVRLRLPRMARVDVEVTGLGEDPALVRLLESHAWAGATESEVMYALPLEHGRAVFTMVPPWARLVVEVIPDDASRPVDRKILTAPATDEPARVELRVGRLRAAIVGRIVSADGAPVAGRCIHATVQRQRESDFDRWSQRPPRGVGRTDADGRFRIELDRDADEVAGTRLVLDDLDSEASVDYGGFTAMRVAAMISPRPRADGTIDLGVVAAARSAPLVSGVVVDTDGKPVPRASVTVQRRIEGRWADVRNASAPTDDAGRFRVQAWVGAGDLRLIANAPGRYLEAPIDVARGESDVLVRLRRGAAFQLVAGVRDAVAKTDVAVVLEGEAARLAPSGPSDTPRRVVLGMFGGDLRLFAVDDLRPGTAAVSLRWRGVPVWGPVPMEFRAGATTFAGDEIDVAPLVRTVLITVRRADGSPAAMADVWTRPSGVAGAWTRADADFRGRLTALAPPGALDVIARDGAASVGAAFGVVGVAAAAVREAPARRVRVRWAPAPGSAAIPSGSVALTLAWIAAPGAPHDPARYFPGPAPDLDFEEVDESGGATLTVLQLGVYAVVARASAHGPSGSFTRTLDHAGPPTLVEVSAGAGPGGDAVPDVVHVPDPAEWARLAADAADL